MPKKRLAFAVLASLCLATSIAGAGAKPQFGFYISPSNGYSRTSYGSFGDVRNHPDSGAFVECGSNATAGYCGLALGSELIWCWTTDPAQIGAIRAMSDGGFFNVSWLEETMECTYVLQYTSSRTTPKTP